MQAMLLLKICFGLQESCAYLVCYQLQEEEEWKILRDLYIGAAFTIEISSPGLKEPCPSLLSENVPNYIPYNLFIEFCTTRDILAINAL